MSLKSTETRLNESIRALDEARDRRQAFADAQPTNRVAELPESARREYERLWEENQAAWAEYDRAWAAYDAANERSRRRGERVVAGAAIAALVVLFIYAI